MSAARPPAVPTASPARPGAPELAFARVAALVLLVVLAHHAAALSMWRIWIDRDTYAHALFVVPIVIGWCWLRRGTLAVLPVRPAWPAAAALAVLGLAWFVLDGLAFNAPSQYVVVAMVPAALAAVLGTAWVRALLFPLGYLFMAVPAGDVLIPALMDWTADVVAFGLRLIGVPVFHELDRLTIPSGQWLVAEACSGIRYLIACAAVGTLYAAAMYRAPWRRAAFIVAMVVAAVVANWVRALAIVLLAHWTDNQLAVGVDHLVYGWVFFGAIVGSMFWLGQRWREDPAAPPPMPVGLPVPPMGRQGWAAALVAALLIGLAPALAGRAAPDAAAPAPLPPVRGADGWEAADTPATAWRPRVRNAVLERFETFERAGVPVGLYLASFRAGARDAKAFASVNELVAGGDPRWTIVGRARPVAASAAGASEVTAVAIEGDGQRLVAWQFFWIDGTVTDSRLRAAWELTLARLRGRSAATAWVTLVTPATAAEPLDSPRLAAFWRGMRPSIERALGGAGA